MIQRFVNRFLERQAAVEDWLRREPPTSYGDLVKRFVVTLDDPEDYGGDKPDVDRITVIDHGDYQGTQVYVIGAQGYQPDRYWYVRVAYGSCSGCDAFEAIRGYSSDPLTDGQVRELWTMMLHMVQRLKEMDAEEVSE